MHKKIINMFHRVSAVDLEGLIEGTVNISGQNIDFHVVKVDLSGKKIDFVVPDELRRLPDDYHQKLVQGRLSDFEKEIKPILGYYGRFFGAGGNAISNMNTEGVMFATDASNYPFNEGHFVILDGNVCRLPEGCFQPSGTHMFAIIDKNGHLSFDMLNIDDQTSYRDVKAAFLVPQIIKNGSQVTLTDNIDGADILLASELRGHLGQIFDEDAYSKMNSPERVLIHDKLIKFLRNSKENEKILKEIIAGKKINWGKLDGKDVIKSLPLQIFSHTYWIETENDEIYLIKTYPKVDRPNGVTFDQSKKLLDEIATENDFVIKNAYIGTNGKDVRVLLPNRYGHMEPIRNRRDGISLDFPKYMDRTVGNFVVVYE